MGGYQTVVVGTDGSETSFRAVDRAAALARDADATLVIVCAYIAPRAEEIAETQDRMGSDIAYQVVGSAPADETLRTARERAARAGVNKIEVEAVSSKPADGLKQVVERRNADLLVIGNRGLNTLAGRIIGSVPLDVVRQTPIDVLIVHTT